MVYFVSPAKGTVKIRFFFLQVFTLLQGRDKEAVSFKIIIPTLFQAVKVTLDSSDSLNFW